MQVHYSAFMLQYLSLPLKAVFIMYNFKWSHRTKDVFNKAVGKSKMVKEKERKQCKKVAYKWTLSISRKKLHLTTDNNCCVKTAIQCMEAILQGSHVTLNSVQ